jgi:hypothetical protein
MRAALALTIWCGLLSSSCLGDPRCTGSRRTLNGISDPAIIARGSATSVTVQFDGDLVAAADVSVNPPLNIELTQGGVLEAVWSEGLAQPGTPSTILDVRVIDPRAIVVRVSPGPLSPAGLWMLNVSSPGTGVCGEVGTASLDVR